MSGRIDRSVTRYATQIMFASLALMAIVGFASGFQAGREHERKTAAAARQAAIDASSIDGDVVALSTTLNGAVRVDAASLRAMLVDVPQDAALRIILVDDQGNDRHFCDVLPGACHATAFAAVYPSRDRLLAALRDIEPGHCSGGSGK